MIAKIGKGSNLYGAIMYNQQKVDKENGAVLLLNKIPDTVDGRYSAAYFNQCFEPYLSANVKTEKTVRHISLNPDPSDKVSDEQFMEMTQEYMHRMGYGNQPYIVFKHMDIDRTHIHIVSTCVGIDGKKIPDDYDHPRSMAICRDLEQKYHLKQATEKEQKQNGKVFKPVEYQNADIKSQIASVVRHLPTYYWFQTLGEFNALLSLFNITTEKVESDLQGKIRQGLLYIPLNERGEKTGHPLKASLFGKNAGLPSLELHFEKSKEVLKNHSAKTTIKAGVEIALQSTNDEKNFKKQLAEQRINVIVRKNDTGRIYGITFIDHNSRTVWNGSRFGKEFAANTFNDYWNNNIQPEIKELRKPQPKRPQHKTMKNIPTEKPHELFDFLNKETPAFSTNETGILESFWGLMPQVQGEDYEEMDFAIKMKKKRKLHRG
jgi:hypothetical protein